MNHDSFLEIGSQHKICEDFIASGNDPCPYVILSDGCSASENSNYGAMILAQLAKQYLGSRRHVLAEMDYDSMGSWVICEAELIVRRMGLNRDCLDATLIVSYLWDGFVYVYVYGDGFIVTKALYGLFCTEISFSSDSPYYLSYRMDHARRKAYGDSDYLMRTKFSSLDGQSMIYDGHESASDSPGHYKFGSDVFEEVYVASDGINSFVRNGEKLPVTDVLKGFLDVEKEDRDRSTKGVFVQRRCRKAIKGFRKDGWDHYDDIAFGGFLCGIT